MDCNLTENELLGKLIDMDYLDFLDYCEKISQPQCRALLQRIDIEIQTLNSEIIKARSKLITEAFKDTNKPPYREGDMSGIPEERSISPDQVTNVEFYLSVINNLYVAEAKAYAKQEVLKGICVLKAKEVMN